MKKILIVDDDTDITVLIENRLKKEGYEVIIANDGNTGIKKALQEKPDLIIMDVMMPRMSGGEAVKTLKKYDNTRYIPILFFTAMVSSTESNDGLEEINVDGEFYPALTKPFEPSKLLSSIKLLLEKPP